MKQKIPCCLVLIASLVAAPGVFAQAPVPPPVDSGASLFSSAQLDQLLGPIALYPDPLIAVMLPAATFPSQIVMADRYISGGGDPNAVDQQPWDASVQAMSRYPDVLKWMDDNLNWTTQVGQSFLNQQQDVMASIQRLRTTAYNLGNLQSTPQEQVTDDDGDIQIVPADPNDLYVPYYQPDQVYYEAPDGVAFVTFGVGWPIGLWLNGDFDWRNHHLIEWDHDHPRPSNWWHEPVRERDFGNATVWRPENHPGAAVANRGDRGWGSQPAPIVVRGSAPQNNEPARQAPQYNQPVRQAPQNNEPARTAPQNNYNERPANVSRPAPAQNYNYSRPEPNGAFIGIQSSRDTSAYSERGQQSMQEMPHAEPAQRSEPAPRPAAPSRPAPSSGGGGGGRSSNRGR